VVAVHQVLPVFAPRDAIGNHAVALRRELRALGLVSEIVAGEVNPGIDAPAWTIREVETAARRRLRAGRSFAKTPLPRDGPATVWLYHASTGSPAADFFATQRGPKLLDYHNITPAELIGGWEPHVGVELEHGRRQLMDLADICHGAMADSAYNAAELRRLGYRRVEVVPIFIDPQPGPPDPLTLARLRERKATNGGADWLFVSRVFPHKGHHELIKALAVYRATYDPAARLHLIGAVGSTTYAEALEEFAAELGLDDAVTLTGSVAPAVLEAHYAAADVYVSASAHEGFGVPLIEAMARNVPVVAWDGTAVSETAAGAGLLLSEHSPPATAAAVARVCADEGLRRQLVRAGSRRVADFSPQPTAAILRRVVAALLGDLGLEIHAA
jgi:glycosyltransferase involved in cell wall biosynthesis